MATPTMPRGFEPQASGYGFAGPAGAIASDVDGGIGRFALQFDRGVQTFNVTLILDRAQFSVWNAFFLQVVKKGSISFNMQLDSGFGMAPHLVNILPGTYSVANLDSALASVAFQVAAESQAYQLDEDEAQSLVDMYDIYLDGTQSILDRIAVFANSDTNVLDF